MKTLSTGIDMVGDEISAMRRSGSETIPGGKVFQFYDTFGIPIDLVRDIAADEGMQIDDAGFEKELEEQRVRSRSSAKFEAADARVFETLELPSKHSEFRGYPEGDFVELSGARVLAIVGENGPVAALEAGQSGDVMTDRTVFYPEGGGQVGDTGTWIWPGGSARVADTQKPSGSIIAHRVEVEKGRLAVGSTVDMRVDEWTRRRTQANHTGTHLLHAALRNVLGESARQMGSLVAPDRLRFDYAARSPLTPEQIREIEDQVNKEILLDKQVAKEVVAREEADKKGAIAFFGEKYGDRVRVVSVPGYSVELCGGCHVPSTGEIGAFKIVSDKSLAAGVRRIEAVTSLGAIELLRRDEDLLSALSHQAKAEREKLPEILRNFGREDPDAREGARLASDEAGLRRFRLRPRLGGGPGGRRHQGA